MNKTALFPTDEEKTKYGIQSYPDGKFTIIEIANAIVLVANKDALDELDKKHDEANPRLDKIEPEKLFYRPSVRVKFKDIHPELAAWLALRLGDDVSAEYSVHFAPLPFLRAVTARNSEARRRLVGDADRDDLADHVDRILDVASLDVGGGVTGSITGAIVVLKKEATLSANLPPCNWYVATDGSTGRVYWMAVPTEVTTVAAADVFLSPFKKAPVAHA